MFDISFGIFLKVNLEYKILNKKIQKHGRTQENMWDTFVWYTT